jgi:hypothetical protein
MTEQNSPVRQSAIRPALRGVQGSPEPDMVQGAIEPYPLCQPDPSKSCGACCGLYNWEDHSRGTLTPLLEKRTGLFFAAGQDPEVFRRAVAREWSPSNPKLLETIYNCEFLGFLDEEKRRVGCLLHPSANRGRDLRDRCFYGTEICAGHLCPSHTHLTRAEQKSVLTGLEDWYLYGLVITDIDLVKEFFHHVQTRLGDSVREERLEERKIRETLRDFFVLKESWKFASSKNRLGKYYFSHSEYQIARVEYEKNWRLKPSRFDKILVSLSSDFQAPEEVLEAESIVEGKIAGFVRAYEEFSL